MMASTGYSHKKYVLKWPLKQTRRHKYSKSHMIQTNNLNLGRGKYPLVLTW